MRSRAWSRQVSALARARRPQIAHLPRTAGHAAARSAAQEGQYSQQEEMPSDFRWQRPPSSSSFGNRAADMVSRASERHLTSTARAAREEDAEVKKTRTHRDMAPRLIHEDYAGPSGHSPNHHRTIRCGPC
ncbi:unnamed protein product [Urochloa humidicola]